MPVGSGNADTGPLTNFSQSKALGALFRDKSQGRGVKGLLEIAVMITLFDKSLLLWIASKSPRRTGTGTGSELEDESRNAKEAK